VYAELSKLSHKLFGDWSRIRTALEKRAETEFTRKNNREKWLKKEFYSLEELNELDFQSLAEDDATAVPSIMNYWRGANRDKLFSDLETALMEAQGVLHSEAYPEGCREPRLRENEQDVAAIKNLLDATSELLHLLKPLRTCHCQVSGSPHRT
jgi:CRISPR-associated protein Cpf1